MYIYNSYPSLLKESFAEGYMDFQIYVSKPTALACSSQIFLGGHFINNESSDNNVSSNKSIHQWIINSIYSTQIKMHLQDLVYL